MHRFKARTAEWPEKIFDTLRSREVPIFSQQAIHKLIYANSAWTKVINDGRKKQKESIKMDITQKKKLLDDIYQTQRQKEDFYQQNLLETQAEMSFFLPTDRQYLQMSRKLQASTHAHQNAQGRLLVQLNETRQQLQDLEEDFHPIRLLSNQSNVKSLINKKGNHCLGLLPQEHRYVLLQNTTCPSDAEISRTILYEP